MLCIVGCEFERPEVGLEGFLAVRQVLLGDVRLLVLRQRAQVLRTVGDGAADGRETLTLGQLVTADRSAAGDRTQTAEVDARTLLVGRFGLRWVARTIFWSFA